MNSRMFTADEDRFCMQYLADLLRKAVEWGILSESDLYTTEEQVLDKLLQDERAAGLWEEYTLFFPNPQQRRAGGGNILC